MAVLVVTVKRGKTSVNNCFRVVESVKHNRCHPQLLHLQLVSRFPANGRGHGAGIGLSIRVEVMGIDCTASVSMMTWGPSLSVYIVRALATIPPCGAS